MPTRFSPPLFCLFLLCLLAGSALAEDTAQPVRIAAGFAKTGEAAVAGPYNYRGVYLAVARLNAEGGLLGHPVDVLELDNGSTPLTARQAARQAVAENVLAVVGATWSSLSLAMAPVLQEARIPMVSTMSTNPDLTKVGDAIFRVCYTDDFQGRVMATFAQADLQAKTAAVLINSANDYSHSLAEAFLTTFIERGGRVVYVGHYQDQATDFSAVLNPVKLAAPDVVFLPDYMRDSSFAIKQARDMGITAVFLGGDSWGFEMRDFMGDAVEGIYAASGWHASIENAENKRFLKEFAEAFPEDEIADNTVLAYDAVLVIADAVRRAGSFEREAVLKALGETDHLPTVAGQITFNDHGDPQGKDAVVLQLVGREMVFVKSVAP